MRRSRRFSKAVVAAILPLAVAAAAVPAGQAGASLRPTGDLDERFSANPLGDERWFASGSWTWEPRATTLASRGKGAGSLLWKPGSHYAGTMNLRFRLDGSQARARLLFAVDPATGAYRWVEVGAGSPGRITVGQTGVIGGSPAGVIQTWRTVVAVGDWLDLSVQLAPDKSVAVTLGGVPLFRAAAAPLTPGLVGFSRVSGPVSFDRFTFTADPDGEPCWECHAGQQDQPLAANVYAYWDGRWWDANKGGNPKVQEGGHGDAGGKPAVGCTGANGCHDMRQPSPGTHRNGTREGRIPNQSVNSYHLRTGFIVQAPEHPWDAQVVFDSFCTTACHPAALVAKMTHESDAIPAAGAVQLGTHLTYADGEKLSVPVDSDLTRRATPTYPDFAPCVSCHDSHGTASAKVEEVGGGVRRSNFMLRDDYTLTSSALCSRCHR